MVRVEGAKKTPIDLASVSPRARARRKNLTTYELPQLPGTNDSVLAWSRIDTVSLQEALIQKAEKEVNPNYFPAVKLYLEGKSIAEIALELGITEGNVKVRVFRARPFLTPFLESAGLKKASAFGEVIESAVAQHRINGVKILGILYTTDKDVARFLSTRTQKIDKEMLDKGYVLLTEYTLPNEYSVLIKWLSFDDSPVKRHRGRLYIRPDDFAKWKETHRKIKPRRIFPPQPNFSPLTTFAKTRKEYHSLMKAAKKGKLYTEKTGKWYFARQEDVDAFLSEKKGIASSGTIFEAQS